MTVEWLPIKGYEGLYEVSNDGRVRSLDRTVSVRKPDAPFKTIKGTEVKQWSAHGYRYVSLMSNGKKHGLRVHRLVAQAFIPNPSNKPTVNHKNGDKSDNSVCNLEWCSYSENEIHSWQVLGKKSPHRLFSDDQVREIRSCGKKPSELARKYGTSLSVMQHIVNRITYKDVI